MPYANLPIIYSASEFTDAACEFTDVTCEFTNNLFRKRIY